MKIKSFTYHHANHQLTINDWVIAPDQHWGIFAAHAQSCELLMQLFSFDEADDMDRSCVLDRPASVAVVSLREQQKLLEIEIANDETDLQDRIDYGSSVVDLLLDAGCPAEQLESLLYQFDLVALSARGFRQLSTGETRRVMLARALATHPDMLVLHEPYAGLDTAHRQALKHQLEDIATSIQLVVITSREAELPDCLTHIALLDEKTLTQTMTYEAWLTHPITTQLSALSSAQTQQWVTLSQSFHAHDAPQSLPNPRVSMHNVTVEYTDAKIFHGLNWQIEAGQHWQVRGPNGCGKSTLLGLILGDHPQCYCNDIQVLGMQRGCGETIWEIKRHIGVVSSALHLQYRVNCSVLEVVLSGFFDSIGVYEKPSERQYQMARAWLDALEMRDYEKQGFQTLDYGQQRLLLIVRALIKQPAILILDEPYQGLDFLNRRLVMMVLEKLAEHHFTQLLYVSHYEEDRLAAIENFVDFIKDPEGGYRVEVTTESK